MATIDERLERLTERHEALTQSVELLTMDVHRIRGILDDVVVSISKLAHVAMIHEQRLDKLEGNS